MAKKEDIKAGDLLAWDVFANATPQEALPRIYEHGKDISRQACEWYWRSIRSKRRASLWVRGLTFGLLGCGAALPILAALSSSAETRLLCTQIGVAALAVAGLLQWADKILGFSSGWLRYVTTVTAMESATHKFELDWADHFVRRNAPVGEDDKRALFEMTKAFEDEIARLLRDETDKWVAEFNAGLAHLSELIKTQRESTERSAAEARQTRAAHEIADHTGSIVVKLRHAAAPVPVKLVFDDEAGETFTGDVWARRQVAPGQHQVSVTTSGATPRTSQRVVKVEPEAIAEIEIVVA